MSCKGGWLVRMGVMLCVGMVYADMTYFAYDGKIATEVLIGSGAARGSGTLAKIDSLASKKYGDSWNVEYSGTLETAQEGKYVFAVKSDDGSALYVDGKRVVNNDGLHGPSRKTAEVTLPAGTHQINLNYFNHTGGHELSATVKMPDGKENDLASVCKPSQKRVDLSAEREKAREKEQAELQKETIKISPPEALVRSIRHLLKTKPRAYKNGRTYLKQAEEFVKTLPDLMEKLEKGDPQAAAAVSAFGKLKYQALVLDNPYLDFDETLVVLTDNVKLKPNWQGTHTIPTKGYKNKLARFNFRTGAITDVYEPKDDTFIGEPDVYFDGNKLLFTAIDTNNLFQIMEVGIDGNNVRQVSSIIGEYVNNYGGAYLPNGNIVFSSTAPMIGVPCIGGSRTVPNIYLMGPNGENARQLTFEQDADWYPTVREDGQIMFLRWEYTDIMHYYSRIMMTMNPDGSNQRAIYGSQSLWPNTMFYARPIPNAPGQFVAVVTGHHGTGSSGKLTIFDTNKGYAHADGVVQHIPGYGKKVTHVTVDQLYPIVKKELLVQFPDLQNVVDDLIKKNMPDESQKDKDYHDLNNDFFNKCYPHLREVYPEMALDLDALVNSVYPQFLQPYPLSAQYYLVVAKLTGSAPWKLYLVDTFDNFVLLQPENMGQYKHMLDPYPVRKRIRPPVIPDKINLQDKEAVCYVQNVYRGPGLKDVPEGTVDALRIFTYAYGYYKIGSHDHIGVESGWDIKRLLGTVKVEKDGSAMFRIPANTTISLQPLDKDGRAIQLFRSWLVAMPGEKLSCIGCHEPPTEPPVTSKTIASGEPPQVIQPWRAQVDGFAFDIEVQPILDAYCVRCHDGSDAKRPCFKGPKAGEKNPRRYSEAYYAFHKYFRRPGPESAGTMNIPYEFHASTSEGVQLIEKGHYGVKLDKESWDRLYTWVDLNVPYFGSWTTAYESNESRHTWTTNISAYAASLRAKYANVQDNWESIPEKPYPVKVTTEKGEERKPPVSVSVPNWPFTAEVARQMQQKAGNEKRVVDLGDGQKITFVRIPPVSL